jgi:hypothetical protein
LRLKGHTGELARCIASLKNADPELLLLLG